MEEQRTNGTRSVYIAISLDGMIATPEGGVDWLHEVEGEGDNGYEAYYSKVDAVAMGRGTYEALLGFNVPFPYQGKACYVISDTLSCPHDHVQIVSLDKLVGLLKTGGFHKLWIIGGGKLISELLNRRLLDELIVTVAPVLLGQGIPLFTGLQEFRQLRLEETRRYGQFVEMNYRVIQEPLPSPKE